MVAWRRSVLWQQFWADQGLSASEVAYRRSLGDGSLQEIEDAIAHPRVRVVGLVVEKVDRVMHGMELGAAGMYNQVRQWAEQGFMAALLGLLFDRSFRVFLTSDHGNIEAEGCGRPSEGSIAEQRGERVRVYRDQLLRAQVGEAFPDSVEWPPLGLPDDFLPLLAPGRAAFVPAGDKVVAHGGASLEELLVPVVTIERRAR